MKLGSFNSLFGVVVTQILVNNIYPLNGMLIDLCSNNWNSINDGWIFDNNDINNCGFGLSTTQTAVLWYGETDGETYNNEIDNCNQFTIETEISIGNLYNGGIIFRSSKISGESPYGHGSGYLFLINPSQNHARLLYGTNSQWIEIDVEPMSIEYDIYYKLKIEGDGTLYTFYVNDNIIWKDLQLTQYTTGSFGLRSYRADVDVLYFNYQCGIVEATSEPSGYPSLTPTAPTSSPTQSCEYTHECSAWGDPHITTFDNTFYHFQGEGYFDYITDDCGQSISNNLYSYLPFTISARHDYCNNQNTVTCVREVLVSLKDNLNTLISFPTSGNPVYKSSGNDATGSSSFIDNYNNNIVSYDISSGTFEINFIYNNQNVMLLLEYHGTRLNIKTTDCLYNLEFCGLCGKFNGDNSDDFTTCDNNDNIQINTNLNDYNSWENIHLFGESCCNEEYDLEYLQNSDCGNNPIIIPPEPDEECMKDNGYANQICQEFYNLFCKSCDDNIDYINNEWLGGCVYDFCSINESCIDVTDMDSAISMGCLSTSFNQCINEKYPSILVDQIE